MNRNEWIWDFNANNHQKITFLSLSHLSATVSPPRLISSPHHCHLHFISPHLFFHFTSCPPGLRSFHPFPLLHSTPLLVFHLLLSFIFFIPSSLLPFPSVTCFFCSLSFFWKTFSYTVIITARKNLGNVTDNEAAIHKIGEQSINNTVASKYRTKFDNWTKSKYD